MSIFNPFGAFIGTIYLWLQSATHNHGISLIMLSVVVSVILLPFYYIAENLQQKERRVQRRMKPKIDEFKSVYKGYELYLYTSNVYRIHNYHPVYALRGALGLLIQVPFLIGAYTFLVNYEGLAGVSFLFLGDLSLPDGLLSLGSTKIHILPFLMSGVNLLSGYLLINDMTSSEKATVVILALFFLIALYSAPSGLLVYWTCNNIFSLGKNLLQKYWDKPEEDVVNNHLRESKTCDTLTNAGFKDWITNTFHQIAITLILINCYIFLGKRLLPEGCVNHKFVEKASPLIAVCSLLIFSLYVASTWWKRERELVFRKSYEPFEKTDLLLLALPMTPIMQYIIANQNILPFSESVIVFVFFLLFSSIFVIITPQLLSTLASKKLTTSISLSLIFIIVAMSFLITQVKGSIIGVLSIALAVAVFLLLLYRKKYLMVLITTFFVVNSGITIINSNNTHTNNHLALIDLKAHNNSEIEESKLFKCVSNLKPTRTPDIFLLIYESYSNQETMNHYGFDNSEQIEYLLDKDFTVYEGTYSIGSPSLPSIAHLLHLDLIHSTFRKHVAGHATGLKLLTKLGYRTHFVLDSDYMIRLYLPQYNFTFPDFSSSINAYAILIKAIFEGEFNFDAKFSTISYEQYLQQKRNILSQHLSEAEFMYTHDPYPGHSPANNIEKLTASATYRYIKDITKTNNIMRKDIEALNLKNREAIVIIAGDHGPFLTKSGFDMSQYNITQIDSMDIQDRFGAFLAIYWPDKSYAKKYDIQILQDVLPAAFSYIYDDDSLFDKTRMARETILPEFICGAKVKDGIIHGGKDHGKPLFKNQNVRHKKQ